MGSVEVHTWRADAGWRRSAAQCGKDSVSTLLKYKYSFFFIKHICHFESSIWIRNLNKSTKKCSVCKLKFCFSLHLNSKCVFPESLARLSTSVMMCFLDQAVPGLGPARWLSALGTVPCIQSHRSEVKPGSSVPNNDWSSNVLTPAPTHRPSCFSAPACINRSVYSWVRTSFLWSPL